MRILLFLKSVRSSVKFYKKSERKIFLSFSELLHDRCKHDKENLEKYSHDETEDLIFYPAIVLIPINTDEISKILRYCNEHHIPVTPAGARTGLSGGALPIFGGVLLSTEKLNKIIAIDEENHQVTTEPGVITQDLQNAVKAKGFLPSPTQVGVHVL